MGYRLSLCQKWGIPQNPPFLFYSKFKRQNYPWYNMRVSSESFEAFNNGVLGTPSILICPTYYSPELHQHRRRHEHRLSIQAESKAKVFLRALPSHDGSSRNHSGSSSRLESSIKATIVVRAWRRNFAALSRYSSLHLDSFSLSFNTKKKLTNEFHLFIWNFMVV